MMEKRSITGKDILRMDGLLPPTRRLPVCNAVTVPSEKKKGKKWSIGGILKRISSIRDSDSSSNEEEMVYCKREPRNCSVFNRKRNSVTLRPVCKNVEQCSNQNNSMQSDKSNTLQVNEAQNACRDSMQSRSSDGSLDGLGRKIRKHKLKARAEAKRELICVDSSSDEDSRKSTSSLTRLQNEDHLQNNTKNGSCNRKSRAARTERYIKRHTKDEGHSTAESLTDISNQRNSLDYVDENYRSANLDVNNLFRPPIHPRRTVTQSNSNTFPSQKCSENLREAAAGLPNMYNTSTIHALKYPANQYITDFNQNNAYAKPAKVMKKDKKCQLLGSNYSEQLDHEGTRRSACPPEPPPRDPSSRVFVHGSHSFPFHGKDQWANKFDITRMSYLDSRVDSANRMPSYSQKNVRPNYYKNEDGWYGSINQCTRRPTSLSTEPTQSYNFREPANNKRNANNKYHDKSLFNETEASKCQRRNNRNDRLSCSSWDENCLSAKNTFPTTYQINSLEKPYLAYPNKREEKTSVKSPSKRTSCEYILNPKNELCDQNVEQTRIKDTQELVIDGESLERKRSSKNLEEALSELEAIYNSLRLGDEDLLDRAERRSMEEFRVKHSKTDTVPLTCPDSPDRMKDDMAYRRMHPKERPTSLSDVVGYSNISYLMASPILSRKTVADDYLPGPNHSVRREEPDVTRDDVVYRSIHHANNTLKVIDPQPPFGIPLGPVTTATESDYLHSTPTKPEQPRSPYIPQCEPDIVTDDLAYRTLRKDANIPKHAVESKPEVTRESGSAFPGKKKRAVRSLSANLYGLINQDRIHLRREPSLQEITDDINETMIDANKLFPERTCSFRRVVSDGELSDYDTHWRAQDLSKKSTDINGNHPDLNLHRKKLRVYISPSTTLRIPDKESDSDADARKSVQSDTALSTKTMDDRFWQDFHSEFNESHSTSKDTESDFTAYTRLCQDLVNLIKEPNDAEVNSEVVNDISASIAKVPSKIDDCKDESNADEPPVIRIQTLGSQYSELTTNIKSNSGGITESEGIDKTIDFMQNSEEEHAKDEDSALDFYLRLADENVKLIAEAFSSVADHLRDSRLSQKNSPTPRRSEIETESTTHDTSTRSSAVLSLDDNVDEETGWLKAAKESDIVPTENSSTIVKWDQPHTESSELNSHVSTDAELDLSRAVHDLQLAAASLCEHEKEIEELEVLLRRNVNENSAPQVSDTSQDKETRLREDIDTLDVNKQEKEYEEEAVMSAAIEVPVKERDSNREGENTKCEPICKSYDSEMVESPGMHISYVTNLITIMITTYSIVLLACFVALLLAIVAAS